VDFAKRVAGALFIALGIGCFGLFLWLHPSLLLLPVGVVALLMGGDLSGRR
jgi:hypothetical protein